MPLNPITDLDLKYSVPVATSGNSLPQGQPFESLGAYLSTVSCRNIPIHGLFTPLSGNDNTKLVADYRCIFLCNNSARYTWTNVVVWLSQQARGGIIALGVDPTIASPFGTVLPQARAIQTPTLVPAGVAFSSPQNAGAGVAIGILLPLRCRALWLRRTGGNAPGSDPDTAVIQFSGISLE